MLRSAIMVAAALVTWPAITQAQTCKQRPEVVAECFMVHGRLQVSSSGLQIWRIGTKRVLGVAGGGEPIVPSTLQEQVRLGAYLYGDYEVCPFTRERPGWMQMVCIESASRLVKRDFNE